jgi:hypothetical protein
MFTSTLSNALPFQHAMNAFGIDNSESISVKSESWGVMVEVLSGEHKGVYDYRASDNSFIVA